MRGHALAGGDFLGGCFLLGGWGMGFLRAPAQRLFAYAHSDASTPLVTLSETKGLKLFMHKDISPSLIVTRESVSAPNAGG